MLLGGCHGISLKNVACVFLNYIYGGGGGVERTRTPPGLFIADVSQLADNDIGGAGGGAKVFGCCS